MGLSSRVYEIVAEATADIDLSRIARDLVTDVLEWPREFSREILSWANRMAPLSYAQVRELANFDETILAPVYMRGDEVDSLPFLTAFLALGGYEIEQLDEFELMVLEDLDREFCELLGEKFTPEEKAFVSQAVQIAIAGLLARNQTRDNYWAAAAIAVAGSLAVVSGADGVAISLAMALRSAREPEAL